jgi:DNA mismatch endonuclease (patch repair protein)
MDPLSKSERSVQMSKVRSKGNRSTEGRAEAAMIQAGVEGWEKHPKGILARPDFFFPKHNLLVFVDGCYWHGCPRHVRFPQSNVDYWRDKIEGNRLRDNRVRTKLRRQGYHVMRVWEHDLKSDRWLKRLRRMLDKLKEESEQPEEK